MERKRGKEWNVSYKSRNPERTGDIKMTIQSSGFRWKVILPFGVHSAMSGDSFDRHNWRVLWAPSGESRGPAQHSVSHRLIRPKRSAVQRQRNPDFVHFIKKQNLTETESLVHDSGVRNHLIVKPKVLISPICSDRRFNRLQV